jgi:hypothetical protein
MRLVGSLWGVQAKFEPCNSNSNSEEHVMAGHDAEPFIILIPGWATPKFTKVAFARPDLHFVMYCCTSQVGVDGTTLEAENGEVVSDVDVIIFATGFDISAPFMASQFDIRARGATLGATLKAKPESYYGMAVAGFPNMFTLLGLNTGSFCGSMTYCYTHG